MIRRLQLVALLNVLFLGFAKGRVLNFLTDFDSIPFDKSHAAIQHNTQVLNDVLERNASNNLLRFPVNTTFHFIHGVRGTGVNNSVIEIDGTIRFERLDIEEDDNGNKSFVCFGLEKSRNVTITSRHRGLIDGRGSQYWGIPLLGYIERGEHRPRLFRVDLTEDLLIENIIFQDSPYHTLYLDTVNRVEIRNISIVARRTRHQDHGLLDLTAFNTDGIDVSGSNVWIHDCDIWVQDDCIAVKDPHNYTGRLYEPVSSNMTFERINASGLGFTIGSIGTAHVKNITFRNSYLHRTVKGIYMKFTERNKFMVDHDAFATVEDILYENIQMEKPIQWPIWIGPAQQADSSDLCHPNPCSLCWPMTPGSECHVVTKNKFRNITLRNIQINNPEMSPGVLLGSNEDTIDDLVFENVLVTKGPSLLISREPFHTLFPGTRQPVHDVHVPSYVPKVSDRVERWLGDLREAVLRARDQVENSLRSYSSAAVNLVQNGGGAEQWYLSVILQAVLGTIWIWVLMAVFMALLTIIVLRRWTRFSRSDTVTGKKRRCFYHCLYAFSFLLFMFSCVCCSILPLRKPQWERTDRYFECTGINNGIARGNTWPIPPCFKYDQQWLSSSGPGDNVASSTFVDSAILFMCLGLVMFLVAYRKIAHDERLREQSYSNLRTRPEVESLMETPYNMLDEEGEGLFF